MTEKRLVRYKVLCDEDKEIARILFEIVETGEEIEGHHQIQEWVNNLYNENEQLKQQIRIFEKFLEHNDLSIEWENFCTVTDCPYDDDNYRMCQECHYLKW